MSLFVDTSVWSLAFRRDAPPPCSEVRALMRALEGGETIIGTGLVLQELLQGFSGPKAREAISEYAGLMPTARMPGFERYSGQPVRPFTLSLSRESR